MIEDRLAGADRATAPAMRLTDRQTEIVRLVASGLSNRDIAVRLHLAETTVKSYLSEVLTRHGLRDRTQLAVRAYESGLVRPGHTAE